MAGRVAFFPQALREVARDVQASGETADVALNTRIVELEDARARLIDKDGTVRPGCHLLHEAAVVIMGNISVMTWANHRQTSLSQQKAV